MVKMYSAFEKICTAVFAKATLRDKQFGCYSLGQSAACGHYSVSPSLARKIIKITVFGKPLNFSIPVPLLNFWWSLSVIICNAKPYARLGQVNFPSLLFSIFNARSFCIFSVVLAHTLFASRVGIFNLEVAQYLFSILGVVILSIGFFVFFISFAILLSGDAIKNPLIFGSFGASRSTSCINSINILRRPSKSLRLLSLFDFFRGKYLFCQLPHSSHKGLITWGANAI